MAVRPSTKLLALYFAACATADVASQAADTAACEGQLCRLPRGTLAGEQLDVGVNLLQSTAKAQVSPARGVQTVKSASASAPNSASAPPALDSLGLLPIEVAMRRAEQTLAQLTRQERNDLLRGSQSREGEFAGFASGYYIGNIPAIPRLGVPALKMQDASSGFRPTAAEEEGTTTCWPSLLALGSTWDESLVERVSQAIAKEFRGKGANVLLGPSVNVHRVARNGRNFEYLSGEDPYLGSRLAPAYIRGVQKEKVMAVVKHFAFNEQETLRFLENSVVDDRTAWELYYPPFEAAVQAGVGAVMCAYNQVNGEHACGNSRLLNQHLKTDMAFPGFVMSDWWALHAPEGLIAGVDQEQPGGTLNSENIYTNRTFTDAELNSSERQEAANAAALRILTSIYRLRLDECGPGMKECCEPPDCAAERATNQTSDEHRNLAREAAAEATILLKNDGILPFSTSRTKKIAILGVAADSDMYYMGRGSGHVPIANPIMPREAFSQVARAAGIEIVSNVTDADVAVVLTGTFSGEGWDRLSLNLDFNFNFSISDDDLISKTAAQLPTVVVMLVPGAVLTPWRDQVSAIVCLFAGGEQSAFGIADVLLGTAPPMAKLPLMLPASPQDQIQPTVDAQVAYVEGLMTSYRNPKFKAAFPFGHGLSYTRFEYSPGELLQNGGPSCSAEQWSRCVRLSVTNVGPSVGAEVVQAYVNFAAEAGEPEKVLRGFQKTRLLKPGETEQVTMRLSERDLSVFQPGIGWVPKLQGARVLLAASSEDIRGIVEL